MRIKFHRLREYPDNSGYLVAEFYHREQGEKEFRKSESRVNLESVRHIQDSLASIAERSNRTGLTKREQQREISNRNEYLKAFNALVAKKAENPDYYKLSTSWNSPCLDQSLLDDIKRKIASGEIKEDDIPFVDIP
jgi:hypothetical protein